MAKFGETLKRERELREISLRQISEATKINIRFLEALEANRFDGLPGGLFNKGFIRAYAKFVGIDGEAMVNSYLQDLKEQVPGNEGASAREASKLHRPTEVLLRRAAPVSDRVSKRGGTAKALAAAIERITPEAVRPAVTGIEEGHASGPAQSRVLAWVVSLVALAGLVFLIAMMSRRPGRVPVEEQSATPVEHGAEPSASPAGVPTGASTPADDASAVLPEIASQSALTLSTLAPPEAKPTAARPAPVARPTAVPIAAPVPTPLPRPGDTIADGRLRVAAAPASSMAVEVQALLKTYIVLVCDGREVVNRTMGAGESAGADCRSVIRVSVTDASAVRLSVNGVSCLSLGDPGTRVFGYTPEELIGRTTPLFSYPYTQTAMVPPGRR